MNSNPAIGNRVRHAETGRYGTVQTFDDDGDPIVRVDGEMVTWARWQVIDCGRHR